jgi:20S proteasome alpha/beta subunit
MTTIAYKNGVIAYDSRAVAGYTITSDSYKKCIERNGVKFVLCGDVTGAKALLDGYFGGRAESANTAALVIDDGELFHVTTDEKNGILISSVPLTDCYAIGSGRDHAFTAMDMGADAAHAVGMAMKRDCGTGGRVRTLSISGVGAHGSASATKIVAGTV